MSRTLVANFTAFSKSFTHCSKSSWSGSKSRTLMLDAPLSRCDGKAAAAAPWRALASALSESGILLIGGARNGKDSPNKTAIGNRDTLKIQTELWRSQLLNRKGGGVEGNLIKSKGLANSGKGEEMWASLLSAAQF